VARIPFRTDSPVDYPSRRLADGLHPDDAGAVEMIRLWAEAVAPLCP